MTCARTALDARAYLMPLVAVVSLSLIYAPILGAGALNYDDPWLLFDNPLYEHDQPLGSVLSAILFDFSRSTRLVLGAEYLPLRDLLALLELRLLGLGPAAMHAVSLTLYASAALLLRDALLRTLGRGFAVELGWLLFVLHPVHVESVAWLAGQKDVLSLLFVCAALQVHATSSARARWLVPLLIAAASLSKSMSVASVFLLLAQDLLRKRRPDPVLYGGAALAIALTMGLHLRVGALVGMVSEPAGGSRYAAFLTMGPVWLRYLGNCLFPVHLSVVYDVPELRSWTVLVVAGYAFVAGSVALAWSQLRRASRLGWYLFLWFFAPLLPVAQVLVPLQHRMADRYLWLSVLAPCLLLAYGLDWIRQHKHMPAAALGVGALLTCSLAGLTFERSILFTDSVLLFSDATLKTQLDSDGPYQLGKALEEQGREREAVSAFREVLRRTASRPSHDNARRATNNYARLLAKQGELQEAERALRNALVSFPRDPKLTRNLTKLLRTENREREAERLERDLAIATDRAP